MKNMLSTSFLGYDLSNPFLLAACPSTGSSAQILRAAREGWAGAVTKTVSSRQAFPRNLSPYIEVIKKGHTVIGLFNNEAITSIPLEQWCRSEIPTVKRNAEPGFILIASVMEATDPQSWQATVSKLEAAGADAIELNVSCPHSMPERFMGTYIGDDPELLHSIVASCKATLSIPLIVKLNALSPSLSSAASACLSAKADALSATNTLLSLSTGTFNQLPPYPGSHSPSTLMGYSGAGIRPIALACVYRLVASGLPISGIGGIETWENAVEYIRLGASTVQIASAAMINGYSIVKSLVEGLTKYVIDSGVELRDIRGYSSPTIVQLEDAIECTSPSVASVIDTACTLCERCVSICSDGAAGAISISSKALHIDENTCTGCGLCIPFCPHDALRFIPRSIETL